MASFPLLNIQEVRNGSTRKKFHQLSCWLLPFGFYFISVSILFTSHTVRHTRIPDGNKNKRRLARWICNNKCGKRLLPFRWEIPQDLHVRKMKNYGETENPSASTRKEKKNICHSNHHSAFTLRVDELGEKNNFEEKLTKYSWIKSFFHLCHSGWTFLK